MFGFGRKKSAATDDQTSSNTINQELYKRNAELAVRNQTLDVLRKLYELATTTLSVQELALQLNKTLVKELHLELGVILLSKKGEKALTVASLESVHELNSTPKSKKQCSIPLDENSGLIAKTYTEAIQCVAKDVAEAITEEMEQECGIPESVHTSTKSVLLYPLSTQERKIGVMLMAFNRKVEDISEFESDSFHRFTEVLSVSLDKALLYEELKAANEKLQELDQAKSEFMSIASHQLRTPLTGIMGYLAMINDGDFGKVNKEQVPIVKDVLEATKRLIRMVNIFLNATRIEAGRFVMNFTVVPFHQVIEDIYKELKPTADVKQVKLVYKKTDLPPVEADQDKIKDVVLNLTDNAIKYSPKGTVTITAEATEKVVHVMVKDTGVGIAKGEVDNLFDKFVRGSGIAQVEPNGSGLGLFIAKKIVEGHGGRIWAESEGEGKGSVFQFEIPLKADPKAKKATEEFKARAKKVA